MAVETIDVFKKDPASTEPFSVDWSVLLSKLGNPTITLSTWEVPAGINKVQDSIDVAKTTVMLSGGTEGVRYDLVNTVVLSNGVTEPHTIGILMVTK